jgi:hypothetical protein
MVVRRAPFRRNPSPLLQPHQRRINRALVQQDLIAAYLLNPPRNPVSMNLAPLTLTTLSTKASLAAHAQMLLDTNPGPINT